MMFNQSFILNLFMKGFQRIFKDFQTYFTKEYQVVIFLIYKGFPKFTSMFLYFYLVKIPLRYFCLVNTFTSWYTYTWERLHFVIHLYLRSPPLRDTLILENVSTLWYTHTWERLHFVIHLYLRMYPLHYTLIPDNTST